MVTTANGAAAYYILTHENNQNHAFDGTSALICLAILAVIVFGVVLATWKR